MYMYMDISESKVAFSSSLAKIISKITVYFKLANYIKLHPDHHSSNFIFSIKSRKQNTTSLIIN